jgi:hypothetical protein
VSSRFLQGQYGRMARPWLAQPANRSHSRSRRDGGARRRMVDLSGTAPCWCGARRRVQRRALWSCAAHRRAPLAMIESGRTRQLGVYRNRGLALCRCEPNERPAFCRNARRSHQLGFRICSRAGQGRPYKSRNSDIAPAVLAVLCAEAEHLFASDGNVASSVPATYVGPK